MIFPKIETERLFLRTLAIEDTEAVAEHFFDIEVSRFVDIGPSERAEDIISFHMNDTGCRWGIFLKEKQNKLIGTCGYHCWLRNEKVPEAEIGFDLSKSCWGKGYMKEAMVPVITFGFNIMELSNINAFIHTENIRSKKFIKKLGFQLTDENKDSLHKYTLNKIDSGTEKTQPFNKPARR